MKKLLLFCSCLLSIVSTEAQQFSRTPTCSTDTFSVNYRHMKTGDSIRYRGVNCTEPSDWGIRFELGFNRFVYNNKTSSWMSNHNSGMIGIDLLFRNLGMGVKFKPATADIKKDLSFNGDVYPKDSTINPGKLDIQFTYTFNLLRNFSVEPFAGMTTNYFYVPDGLTDRFKFSSIQGFTTGLSLNKYIRLKDFQFLAVFARFGYGFINFKKLNPDLGKGQFDMSFGIAYKAFVKKHTTKVI